MRLKLFAVAVALLTAGLSAFDNRLLSQEVLPTQERPSVPADSKSSSEPSDAGNSWITYRGSYDRHGSTAAPVNLPDMPSWIYESAAAPQQAWSTAEGRVMESLLLENRISYDSAIYPIIAEGRVFFGSSVDHQLHCVDLYSGQSLWTFVTGGPVRLAPSYDSGRVYFGCDDGLAYCLDANSGELVWKLRPGPADDRLLARGEMISRWPVRTGVLIDDGLAYFGAGIFPHERIILMCVDGRTGQVQWTQDHISELDAGRTGVSPQGYLMSNENLLFVPSGRSLPAVFDKHDGQLVHSRTHSWRTTAGGVVGGYRALLSDGQLYASGDHHWLAMDQETGDAGFGWFQGRDLVIQGDFAFSVTGSELVKMHRLDYAVNSRKRQELRLKYRDVSRSIGGATGKSKDKLTKQLEEIEEELQAIQDIGIVWRVPCEDRSSLLATANIVLVGGQDRVTGYSIQTGHETWQQKIPGEVAGLAAAAGAVLVSTDLGAIHTFIDRIVAADSLPDVSEHASVIPTNDAGKEETASKDTLPLESKLSDDEEDELTRFYASAAEHILQVSEKDRGFCLVLDCGQGRLAEQLALQSQLKIYAVDRSLDSVFEARRRLLDAGLYGHRVTVHHVEHELPYSNYFADLIVSDDHLRSGSLPDYQHLARHLKPMGGKLVLPLAMQVPTSALVADQLEVDSDRRESDAGSWLESLGLSEESLMNRISDSLVLQRGALPGAGSWTHLYGSPANTAVGNETRVKSELGVLWYGDPGPGDMVNRHDGAVGPLAVAGRLFVQGENTIAAYDAYNGTFLWRYENPAALRTGVFQNQNPGNLAATEDRLFHFVRDECYELDAATGEVVRIHYLPPGKDDGQYQWGYVAISEGVLLGTATIRKEIEERKRRRGRVTEDATDQLFAIDLASGLHVWTFQGTSISHHTIAVDSEKVYFIDSSLTEEQRQELLQRDKAHLELLTGEERQLAEERAKRADIRRAVALDLFSGDEIWSSSVDVTDCSDIGIGGGRLTLMVHDGTLLLGGANANGHYWKQFIEGAFTQRRLVALSADHGYQKWAKDANYKGRPIIVGDQVLAEPWSFNLNTGEQLTRIHPTTGQKVPWSLMRTGHHCGILTGCESGLLMFRSGDTAFYDLEADQGANHFSGHRLGCWINAIPACGLIMIPEASAGCVCQFSIASTIVLEPRQQEHHWTIHSSVGSLTPVQSMSLNLGAPGDRREAEGKLWLSYPRRKAYKETSLSVDLDLQPVLEEGGKFQSVSEHLLNRDNLSDELQLPPWVLASWLEGVAEVTLPLLGKNDSPADYQIDLYLSACPVDGGSTQSSNDDPQLNTEKDICRFNLVVNGEPKAVDVSIASSSHSAPNLKKVTLGPCSVKQDATINFEIHEGKLRLHAIEVQRLD